MPLPQQPYVFGSDDEGWISKVQTENKNSLNLKLRLFLCPRESKLPDFYLTIFISLSK